MIGDSKDVLDWAGDQRDFSLITSSRYQETSMEAANADGGKVKVKCLAFPEHDFYAQVLVKYAARAIEAYSKWFGPYPYPEYTIAESYFGWNGNELSAMVMIDERVFGMPHLARHYVEYLISHETCHQWFYNVIGTNGYRETFMDEAIVVHLSHRLLDEIEGKNNELLNYPFWLAWLPGIRRENYRYSQFFYTLKNGDLKPAVDEMQKYENVVNLFAAVYDRGSKIVGMIQNRLGPTAFIEFLRRIYPKYYFRIMTVEDFQRELEEYTGRKWDEFFKDWLYTNGMSDWSVDGVKFRACPAHRGDSTRRSSSASARRSTSKQRSVSVSTMAIAIRFACPSRCRGRRRPLPPTRDKARAYVFLPPPRFGGGEFDARLRRTSPSRRLCRRFGAGQVSDVSARRR